MIRFASLALAAAVVLTGCDGLKEAMTAHVDVAAHAGSQELSVERLGDMLGGLPPNVALDRTIARTIADVWVNYQLLALAAARGDSLKDREDVEGALVNEIASLKAQKLRDSLAKGWVGDSNVTEAIYAQGNLLSAQHILFQVAPTATPQQKDSVRRRAESIRARATAANFAQLAAQHSEDPGSKDRGGLYAAFPRAPTQGAMVPEFEKGVIALQPGQIGPLVETQFGYHIIRRPLLSEVRSEYGRVYAGMGIAAAESTYRAGLEKEGNVQVKDKGIATARAVAQAPEDHRDDKTVIASSAGGNFTAQRLATFIRSVPNRQQQMEIAGMIAQAPDSMVERFMRELASQDLIVREADRANLEPDSVQLADLRDRFGQMIYSSWQRLGVAPTQLGDSASSEGDRERIAAERVERYLDALLRNQAEFVVVPEQLERLLRAEYRNKVVPAGLDRAIERAQAVRAAADSVRAAQPPAPPSAVPVPGQQPPPTPGGGAPPPAPPPSNN